MSPDEKYAAQKPRKGDIIICREVAVGTVTCVEGTFCWRTYPNGESLPFIWCFNDGLNTLHDWPSKRRSQ